MTNGGSIHNAGDMKNSHWTVIHFDYGGYYSRNGDEFRWISSGGELYTLVMKTSINEITYLGLVDKICKKIKMDLPMTKLKISWIRLLMDMKAPSYILDDEDVLGYLLEVNNDQHRVVLHVELIHDVEENQECEQVVREDRESEIGVTNEELLSSGRVNDGVLTLHPRESSGQYELDNVGFAYGDVANVDGYGLCEDHEVRPVVVEEQFANVEWEDGMYIAIGQEFERKEEVIDLVAKSAHKNCFEFTIKKSDTVLYVVKCREAINGCKWSLRAAKLKNANCFSIRTYNKMHSCSRSTASTSINRRKGTPRLVAYVIHDDYPGKFDTPTPKNIMDMVQTRLGMKVSYTTAWRGKKQAAIDVRGSPENSYKMVYSYLYMLEQKNPGTVSRVELDEQHKFKYLFFALGACIKGFEAMRKVIIVDGTHIRTVHGGVLIVAMAQDPDHHHYPLAFGVVDREKDASWTWFFTLLKSVIPDAPELVFLSYRNQSLIKSVREVFPLSKHGFCIYHLSQNVKASCSHVNKDIVGSKFMECAKAYTEVEFKKLYDAFRRRYPAARDYLDRSVDEKKWARCYFPGERYNIDTTNSVESFNGVFAKAREYSLLTMIDATVEKIVEWFNKHRKSSAGWNSKKLVPTIDKIFHSRCAEAKKLIVLELNSFALEYSVVGSDGYTYLVDLRRKTCSCRYFDIDPCVHAIADVGSYSQGSIQLHELCSKYYWNEQWALAYSETIYPVPHMSQWIVTDCIRDMFALPPNYVKKKGRNQTTRFTSVGEHGQRKRKSVRGRLYDYFDASGSSQG